jgi:hypothetical protein
MRRLANVEMGVKCEPRAMAKHFHHIMTPPGAGGTYIVMLRRGLAGELSMPMEQDATVGVDA